MSKVRWLFAALLAVALAPVAGAAQQPATITGRVVSEGGAPIASASVFIQSLNVGTLTRENGTYTLIVPASRVRAGAVEVTAQSIGYRSQSATVNLQPGATASQDFQLGTDVLELEGIVATGQGTTTTRERAVSTINSVRSEEITQARETNIVSALSGKAPNVTITSASGDPGAGAYIQIRGAASIEGTTQPLFVVDGTPISNESDQISQFSTSGTAIANRASDINPQDIERVEILKGAAATAIYGARGANGVILITTKSGRAGTTRATLSSSYSFDEVSQLPELQTEFGQGLSGKASATSPFSWGPRLSGVQTFDHAGELFEAGNKFENNLTMSGGNERTTYFLSVGRLDHNGTTVGDNDEYVRNSARLRGSHYLRDDLQVTGNIAYSDVAAQYIQQGSNLSGLLLGALRTPPDFNNCPDQDIPCYLDPATGLHRSYRLQNPTTILQSRGYDNPFFVINEQRNTSDVGRAFGNVGVDYTPTPWLRLSYLLGADYSSDERLTLRPKSSSDTPGRQGDIIRANIVRQIWDSNLLATFTGSLNENITGSLTAGQNLNQESEWWNQADGSNLILGTEETDFAVTVLGDEYKARTRIDGYFLNGETTLFDQLTLNATARWDGSSSFGGEGRRFFYPGVGASWVFTNSPFVAGLTNFMNFGKLRGSWGVSGRMPPIFSNVSAFTTGAFRDSWISTGLESIYAGNEGVFTQNTLGNPDIQPERKEEWEVGADVAFFDSRLALGVTYYNRSTTDAILQLPVAVSTGFGNAFRNAAEIDNDGWEVTLDLNPVRMQNVNWSINANWGKNESCVQDLAGAESFSLGGFTDPFVAVLAPERDENGNITRCYEFGALYGRDYIRFGRGISVGGVNIDQAFPDAPEGAIYVAADGFPRADPQQRYLGNPNPEWTAGIRNTVTLFNNLTISGLFDIKSGGVMYNGTKGALSFFGTAAYTAPFHGEGATRTFGQDFQEEHEFAGPGAGKSVTIDQLWFISRPGSNFTGSNAFFVEDAGYVKLRDVSVAYTFAQPFVQRLGFASLDLVVSGRNLRTWTDYTGIDPESNLTAQNGALGLDYFNNPQTRSFIFTVNLNR